MKPLAAILLLLFAGAVRAQFQNLSPTHDADAVYFSTRLRPRGSVHLPWPKVYRWDASGFHLVEQRPDGEESLRGWQVLEASLSSDSRVIAVNSSSPCRIGTACIDVNQEFTGIVVDGTPVERFPAHAQVSGGGRYVLLSRLTGLGPFPGPELRPQGGLSRYDVETGALERVGNRPADFGRWISADGTILTSGLRLVSPSGEETNLGEVGPGLSRALLAGDASFVVYQLGPGLPGRFDDETEVRIRFADGEDRLLAQMGFWPSVAVDVPRILYLAPVNDRLQTFMINSPDATAVQVTFEEWGIAEAAISGDGQFAYVVTGAGEVIKIGLTSPSRMELIEPTPDLRVPLVDPLFNSSPHVEPPLAPGSTYRLPVLHLPADIEVAEPSLPEELEGVRVTAAGDPARVYWLTPWEIGYQVAWETSLSPSPAPAFEEVVLKAGDPEWEIVVPVEAVRAAAPRNASPAIHGDWRGLVTDGDPAVPGEYVHIYTTGLGPVQPFVETGQAPPVSPLARVTPVPECQQTSQEQPLTVAYAGLAPGLVGFYILTIQIPPDYVGTVMGIACESAFVTTVDPIRP